MCSGTFGWSSSRIRGSDTACCTAYVRSRSVSFRGPPVMTSFTGALFSRDSGDYEDAYASSLPVPALSKLQLILLLLGR